MQELSQRGLSLQTRRQKGFRASRFTGIVTITSSTSFNYYFVEYIYFFSYTSLETSLYTTMEIQKVSSILQLPIDLMSLIFGMLPHATVLLTCSRVCSSWKLFVTRTRYVKQGASIRFGNSSLFFCLLTSNRGL